MRADEFALPRFDRHELSRRGLDGRCSSGDCGQGSVFDGHVDEAHNGDGSELLPSPNQISRPLLELVLEQLQRFAAYYASVCLELDSDSSNHGRRICLQLHAWFSYPVVAASAADFGFT